MPQPLVRLQGITKSFAGRPVVDRLSFEVRPGEIFALLGPNGAGKTTVVRMLLGIIAPDEGRIEASLDGASDHRLPPVRPFARPAADPQAVA